MYLGRVDNQVKIQGYRVELGEVEAVLREVAGVDAAIAVPWPETPSGADSLVGFVAGSQVPAGDVVNAVAATLPPYMRVSDVVNLDTFPLNSNGKIDRGALRSMLAEGRG